MTLRNSILLLVPLALLIGLLGCEGPEGPEGPQGPAGPDGPGLPIYNYLGDNASKCGHCHDATIETWTETKHHDAYETLEDGGQENNPYCLQCHTVGFDVPVNYGDTTITDHGSDHSGYDDYWPPETAEDQARLHDLEGVQCENCHGPMGPTIYDHSPVISYATREENGVELSLCARCHEGQIEEWHESGHGTVLERHGMASIEDFTDEWGRSSCNYCHTSEGFIARYDPDNAGLAPEQYSMVGCVTCHDPHNATNEKQLRRLADVDVEYDAVHPATMTDYGAGQLCAQCHHARRDAENVQEQIEDGDDHFGPHGSPQMDMFLGTGSYEIIGDEYVYDRGDGADRSHKERKNNGLENGCVSCHLTLVVEHSRDHHIHNFEPQVETCQACHTGASNFDIGGSQTEISTLMDSLITMIGVPVDSLGSPTATTPELRMAGYAYVFVANDGSHGVHNYRYAHSLLKNAIDFLIEQNLVANR